MSSDHQFHQWFMIRQEICRRDHNSWYLCSLIETWYFINANSTIIPEEMCSMLPWEWNNLISNNILWYWVHYLQLQKTCLVGFIFVYHRCTITRVAHEALWKMHNIDFPYQKDSQYWFLIPKFGSKSPKLVL